MRSRVTSEMVSPKNRMNIYKWSLFAALALVFVYMGNIAFTWSGHPDPRAINRDNFLIDMYMETRFFGWDSRCDKKGMQDKLNELFPAGTSLRDFDAFISRLMSYKKRESPSAGGTGYFSSRTDEPNENEIIYHFVYAPEKPTFGSGYIHYRIWTIIVTHDEASRLKHVSVDLNFR